MIAKQTIHRSFYCSINCIYFVIVVQLWHTPAVAQNMGSQRISHFPVVINSRSTFRGFCPLLSSVNKNPHFSSIYALPSYLLAAQTWGSEDQSNASYHGYTGAARPILSGCSPRVENHYHRSLFSLFLLPVTWKICLWLIAFTVPTKIVNLSRDVVVNEGSNVTLLCQASGKPEPSISWKLISSSGKLFY